MDLFGPLTYMGLLLTWASYLYGSPMILHVSIRAVLLLGPFWATFTMVPYELQIQGSGFSIGTSPIFKGVRRGGGEDAE